MTHAALPVVDLLEEDRWRVYFSTRDRESRAQIGYFDIDWSAPDNVLAVSDEPVLRLGKLGTFDDHGVTSACIVTVDDRKYQFYTGWALGVTVPFYFYIGLAISVGQGPFVKISEAPILERNATDPYLTASPSVLIDNGVWRMWYTSCTGWTIEEGKPKHFYHIRYAESKDGIHWQRTGIVCIDFQSSDEFALARPTVLKDTDCYRMWFSHRGPAYRIGYAESRDGITWQRLDHIAGLDVSPAGWDSEMTAYGHVVDHRGTRYMFYNGNGYGKTGIGYAIWRDRTA